MRGLLRIGLRNIRRNRRRTLLTIITAAVGSMLTLFISAFMISASYAGIDMMTKGWMGQIQINPDGYDRNISGKPFDFTVPYSDDIKSQILAVDGVIGASARIMTFGMLTHLASGKTAPTMINGWDPVQEQKVSPQFVRTAVPAWLEPEEILEAEDAQALDASISSDGMFADAISLDDMNEDFQGMDLGVSGDAETTETEYAILLNPPLIKGLQAKTGDRFMLVLEDRHGMEQAIMLKLAGEAGINFPNMGTGTASRGWMDSAVLHSILNMQNEATQWAITTDDSRDLVDVAADIRAILPDDKLLIQWWAEFLPDLMEDTMLNVYINVAIALILYLIVLFAIMNTSMMAVMERTREIGMIMAFGYRRRHISMIFLTEGTATGIIGGLIGIALAGAGLAWLGYQGIPFEYEGMREPLMLHPWPDLEFLIAVFVLASLTAIIATLAPALRASRLKAAEALATA